ncbi:uncharacterized protein LOC110021194 [Phalaenopsis equestris]|uniref:uncharacterized protein LOC110021194 n=1 Tax=Phalaenopsis equestris TaxID=78828 RepID=UPI0009E48E6A|nr:uncharacterized protein LOC110021194 [Phalaenopsis equestris]
MSLLLHCSSHRLRSIPFVPPSSSSIYSCNIFSITKNQNARRFSSCCLPLRALPIIDQELLRILCESDASTGKARTHLPAVRSYETDLARFTLIGSVSFDQAVIAAAADGGEAADEHLSAGTSTMVVETVFPSGLDEHSTVSTRLFLPAEMVKEKAKKLKNSLARNIIDKGAVSKNILAMTFRQVVVQQLWSFQLALFYPGTERNMEDLGNTREAQAGFVVNSSDESFISSLAEVVTCCALESAKSNYIQEAGGLHSKSALHWFQKPPKNSVDSSISICRISETEVAKEARNLVETYKLVKGKYVNRLKKVKYTWWPPPDYSRLDLIGGPGFGSWTCEFIPAYKLQINTSVFKDLKLEGCQNVVDNRSEALLTHYQMVELANILDMFYEDRYTMPNKRLLCDLLTEAPITLKRKNTPWKLLFTVFAGGFAIMTFAVLAQLCWPKHAIRISDVKNVHSLSKVNCSSLNALGSSELEALCVAIINKIKDELGWSEDLMVDKNIGVWTGALPMYLRNEGVVMEAISSDVPLISGGSSSESHAELSPTVDYPSAARDLELQKTAPDIASYQAVLTKDGKLIGFQPTSRVAVNHWASNPLAKSLYGVHNLSPGLFEPGLNIPVPPDAIPIELLMSINPESQFALARPIQ